MKIAGFGCRPGTDAGVLRALLDQAGGADVLATIPDRAAELTALSRATGLPLHLVDVAGVATPTQSPRIIAKFATGSVAEAAALKAVLAAAGPGARLTVTRQISPCGCATIAIAAPALSVGT
ncbi:MAG: cobalamin biosynthesis protein [Paracoccus sp. (in: a-proteobacteria)]|nr:cobalamin biosynthesis protein [Paracoccus sp. (in: a-proteobacteria)]MDO5648578.1 cobalamin biosynthesis protein [Paracoccus sp. (in: a-proteobacteria)]